MADESDCEVNTSIAATDPPIERTRSTQYNRAQRLLQDNARLLARIADALMRDGELAREALAALLGRELAGEPAVLTPYAQRLAVFAKRQL